MFRFKYYAGLKEELAEPRPQGPAAGPEIDFDQPAPGFLKRLGSRVSEALLRGALGFLCTFWPNPRFGRLVIVTRAADVCEVLKNSGSFGVPYEREMIDLTGANSVLGLDGCPHAKMSDVMGEVLRLDDQAREDQRLFCNQTASALITNAGGRIDVMGDLITRCATESCARYFGLTIEDPAAFAGWTMAISQLLFADPFGDPETLRRARYAAERVEEVVKRAIRERRALPPNSRQPAVTLVDRFLKAQASPQPSRPEIREDQIRSNLVALVTALVPTIPLAAGKMLQVLYKRPKVWRAAQDAARKHDRVRLRAMLFEAGRLNPALFPGQWRYAKAEGVVAEHTLRRRYVPKDSVVLVATGAALRDPRTFPSPGAFRPDRKQDPDLMFGGGPHYCLGSDFAMTHITEILLVLLALEDLRPAHGSAGKMRFSGPFPRQLDMEFTPPDGGVPQKQSMIAVCAPLADKADVAKVRDAVEKLGNPVCPKLCDALRATNRIHFASLSLVDLGDAKRPLWSLLLEVNADGPPDAVLSAVSEAASDWLKPIFAETADPGGGLFETLRRYNIKSHHRPRGKAHLNFNGVAEFSVADIQRQRELAEFARRAVDRYLKDNIGRSPRPMLALRYVRQLIRGEIKVPPRPRSPAEKARRADLLGLIAEGPRFRDFLMQPGRRRLALSDWVDITVPVAWGHIALSKDAMFIWSGLGVVWLMLSLGLFLAFGGWGWETAPRLFLAIAVGFWGELLFLGLSVLGLLGFLRFKESRDVPDARFPDSRHLAACTKHEDEPGYAQNHFISTPTLKPGLFRRFTLAVALWGIGSLIAYGFRPGFILNMGTIHYAKWFRPPGSRRLVFLGNYDGSWSSYLEDFITEAHLGQTAGWSNCEGFPPTRFLVFDGAQDGERFKRWVRRQQVPSACWFSHFPDLTTDRIRNNALIHQALACAHTDSAARAWLACFGSQQRPESTLETEEIQSLVFGGFQTFHHAVFAVLRLPDDGQKLHDWLTALASDGTSDLAVTFGDASASARRLSCATSVAFSKAGLEKLGVPDGQNGDGLATFPSAFVTGMSGRARTLGDVGKAAPETWRWTDVARDKTPGSDGVLMIYAATPRACKALLEKHKDVLGDECAVVKLVPTKAVMRGDMRHEHFGFRDGISQPVIRGARRSINRKTAGDIVEPGEFILGYRGSQGYFPTTPVVEACTDSYGDLPTAQSESPQTFPSFAESPLGLAFHDFGRNGSYLVLRQLEQHVSVFDAFTAEAAVRLGESYPHLSDDVGAPITSDWVAAKLLGRRKDGTPLVGQPGKPGKGKSGDGKPGEDNAFAFGVDDPQGLRCPLGAHIRRANPRDSLHPGDADDRMVVNRHRLLRRGRSYSIGRERGLLFACLCTDLERQFEFVQQTWLNSSSFAGLDGETDPLMGAAIGRAYTIPTPAGAVRLEGLPRFVTPRAGGYYFLPSRSALVYLANQCAGASASRRGREQADA